MKKTTILALILLICPILNSCLNDEILFSELVNQEILEIEAFSNRFCVGLGLDFNENPIKEEIYFRCKINVAKHKIIDDKTDQKTIRHNFLLRQYIQRLEEEFANSFEKLNDYRNVFLSQKHHQICQKKGFDIDSFEQNDVEKYINCRQNLIRSYQINPPYKITHYLDRPRDTYNIGFVINKKQDDDFKKIKNTKQDYKNCTIFNIKSDEFSNCKKDFDEQKLCYFNANISRAKKEMEEKIICQKKLYSRFDESLVKKEKEEKSEIDRKKLAIDIYNNNSFINIGIDNEMLKSFEPQGKKEEVKEEKKEEIDFNNENGLYTKAQFTRLRQKFIASCNEEAEKIIAKYLASLNQNCRSLTLKWEKNVE